MMDQQHHKLLAPGRLACAICWALRAALALLTLNGPGAAIAGEAVPVARFNDSRSFSIAAQPLQSALMRFAGQSGAQIFFTDATVAGMRSVALNGNMEINAALRHLLGANPVTPQFGANGQITLRTASSPTRSGAIALDELTISAGVNGAPDDWVYDEPRSVSVISRQQLDDRPARHAADIIEQTSGVYSSLSQQDPALSVNIRGIQDFGRVNMNIDGMRQNFQKSGHGQRNGTMFIDPELLSGVTVEKGATSGMGSSGTLGGIATFNTLSASDFLSPDKGLGGQLRAATGDNATHFIGSAALAFGNERGDVLIAASERHLGDYWPGNQGKFGSINALGADGFKTEGLSEKWTDDIKNNKVTYSRYQMRSRLAKAGINLAHNQRLQLSYLQTQVDSPNASDIDVVERADSTPQGWLKSKMGWRSTGYSEVMSRNLALDYQLAPDHLAWLDLSAKLYYVDTDDDSLIESRSAAPYSINTRLRTWGAQLQNSSRFHPAHEHKLSADYGIEFFYDKANSHAGRPGAEGITPEGSRAMASLFSQLSYEYADWLTLQGGLRYDRYRLRGQTGIEIWEYPWIYTADTPCTDPRGRCSRPEHKVYKSGLVDRRQGRLSPSLTIAARPALEWLELYATYGRSWRPPAITETLSYGSAHSSASSFPNPLLAAERSRNQELGFNIQKPHLLVKNDRLVAKAAYFDTRVANYTSLAMGLDPPGSGIGGIGNLAYVNSLSPARFRGLEFQLNYDAGLVYADFTWTHMIGHNQFCYKEAWLGNKRRTGPGSRRGYRYYVDDPDANNSVYCGNDSLFGSSAFLPGDRGSFTLGGRVLKRRLDMGAIARFAPGFQQKPVSVGVPYTADWPKYLVVDLYASYRLTEQLTLRGAVENLANRGYIVTYGESLGYTPGRGRTVQAGLEYLF